MSVDPISNRFRAALCVVHESDRHTPRCAQGFLVILMTLVLIGRRITLAGSLAG